MLSILYSFVLLACLQSVVQAGDTKHQRALEASMKIADMANKEAVSEALKIKKDRPSRKGLKNLSDPSTAAVIVVDVQRDFTQQPFGSSASGSLAVDSTGKDYTDAVGEFIDKLRKIGFLITFTQDWHPVGHVSFASRWSGQNDSQGRTAQMFNPFTIPLPGHTQDQVLWPDHCIQESLGAEIIVPIGSQDIVVKKGMNLDFDSYSGFKDRNGTKTAMEEVLDTLRIKNLVVVGIATDYCVKETVLDALDVKRGKNKNKYNVFVVTNLCRGVADTTSINAFKEMQEAGAVLYWIKGLNEGDSREKLSALQGNHSLKIHVAKDIKDFLQKTSIQPSLVGRSRKSWGGRW